MLIRKVCRLAERRCVDLIQQHQVKQSLKNFREKNDVRGCLGVLETCTRANFAAVESSRCVYLNAIELILHKTVTDSIAK